MTYLDALRTRLLLRVFRSRVHEDLLFTIAVTLAAGFYALERYLPYAELISWTLSVSVIIAWLWFSFTSGFMRRAAFVVVSVAYWIIPQIIIIAYSGTDIYTYDATLHAFARVSEILVRLPLYNISRMLSLSVFITGIGLLLLCEAVFIIGFTFRKACRNFGWYCSFRGRYDV